MAVACLRNAARRPTDALEPTIRRSVDLALGLASGEGTDARDVGQAHDWCERQVIQGGNELLLVSELSSQRLGPRSGPRAAAPDRPSGDALP